MLQKDNRSKVLRMFFEDPLPKGIGFQLREISKKVGVAPPSVKKYLQELEQESLITIKKHRIYNYPIYYANLDHEKFIFLKRLDTILRSKESGLLDYLWEKCQPGCIILFGSAARGEDLKESDLDLFVESESIPLHLEKYEKALQRRISIFFGAHFNTLSKELINNIINGIILKGYLKVFYHGRNSR